MRIYLLGFLLLFTIACKDKKPSLTGNDQVSFDTFIGSFPKLQLPFNIADSNMGELADTATIGSDVFRQFVPDTAFQSMIGKDTKIAIHPIGRIDAKEQETYLTLLLSSKQKRSVHLVVFKDKKFSAAMPLLVGNKDDVTDKASIDRKLSIVINREWMNNNDLMYHRTIYAYNNVGVFTVVLTETNEQRSQTAAAIINPIDTFARKNKYSGDYVKGKNNFLSLRDGKTPNDYLFFVHFMNDGDNACGGDLKGSLKIVSEGNGIYNQGGDPCVIDFTFSKNTVKVKEQGSCGNYRGITCFFDHTFTRKKETSAAAKKK